jgi:hypothetical protein
MPTRHMKEWKYSAPIIDLGISGQVQVPSPGEAVPGTTAYSL